MLFKSLCLFVFARRKECVPRSHQIAAFANCGCSGRLFSSQFLTYVDQNLKHKHHLSWACLVISNATNSLLRKKTKVKRKLGKSCLPASDESIQQISVSESKHLRNYTRKTQENPLETHHTWRFYCYFRNSLSLVSYFDL